jgi:hypothetical protein
MYFWRLITILLIAKIKLITKRILNPNNVFITQNWPDITTGPFWIYWKEFKKQTRLEASRGKKGVRPCTCLYIDSIFTWILTRPCGSILTVVRLPGGKWNASSGNWKRHDLYLRKGNSVVNKIKQNGVKYTIHVHTTRCLGKIRSDFQHWIIQ